MISQEYLKEISKESGLHLYQQEKDYLLKLFLYFYYKRYEDAVFKGGTCIKYTLELNRFSEDLDFELTTTPKKFKKQVDKTLEDIREVGIENQYLKSEFFEDTYTCEIKFKGPRYSGKKHSRNKFRIDAGKRLGLVKKPQWTFIDSQYPETKNKIMVYAMNPQEILVEKTIALFERNKGRDLYDVWFMLKNNIKLDHQILTKKYDKKIDWKKIVDEKTYENDIKRLVGRVIPYSQVKSEIKKELEPLL